MQLQPPYLKCDKHGIQKGYLLCMHLKLAASIAIKSHGQLTLKPTVQLPAVRAFGLVACDSNFDRHPEHSFTNFCERCLRENKLLDDSVIEGRAMIKKDQLEGLKAWGNNASRLYIP